METLDRPAGHTCPGLPRPPTTPVPAESGPTAQPLHGSRLSPEELDLTAVDAAVTQRVDGTQVIVFADKRPDDNTVTEITIQSRH